jgi:hypothetical protein
MGSKPKTPKPVTPDYAKATGNILGVYESTTPRVQAFEGIAREGYGGLNLGDISGAMFGIGGEQGIVGQTGQAATQAQQQIQGLRGGEYQGMTEQAGAVRGLLGEMSPEAQRMMQLQSAQAEEAYARSQGLSPQEQRLAQQGARESFASAGRLGGNAAVASEILNRESSLANKRNEAAGATSRAYQTSQNYYSPAQGLLQMTPAGMAYGQQYAAQGQAQLGQAAPKLFDYSTGFRMEQSRVKAQDAYNQAKYQQQLQSYSSGIGAIGTLGGAALGFAVGGPMGAQMGAQLGGGLAGGMGGSSTGGGYSSFTPENFSTAKSYKGIFG